MNHTRSRRLFLLRSPWRDILEYVALAALTLFLVSRSTARLGYYWQWYRIPRYLFYREEGRLVAGALIRGLLFTFKISGVSLALAIVIGLATALVRLSDSLVGRLLAKLYLQTVRNTPLVIQIYLVYFVIGPILGLGRFASAALALSLFEGTYLSEIFRAGITSIHRGQWEAAHSLGMSTLDTYRDIILPQALRRILPPLTSQVVTLFKNSALVSIVALSDLAMQARIIASRTFLVFEVWFTTAALYLVVTAALSSLVYEMEKRLRVAT